jgi:chemotaxis protein MotA
MDLASLIGAILGIMGLIVGLLVGGADILIYADISSVFITIVGSFGAICITHPLWRILMIPRMIAIIFRQHKTDEEKIISHLVAFSEKARRDGLLALEDDLDAIEDPFFRKGVQLVVDGTDPEIIKMILFTELNQIEARHEANFLLWDDWSKTAPAFGMIGTLTGLIAMMRRMEDKTAIGRGMSQALLTTLYGAVLSYLFFIPFKRKLEMKSQDETLVKEILIEGVLSIQAGDNPRILEEKLYTFLPPARREGLRDEMTKT